MHCAPAATKSGTIARSRSGTGCQIGMRSKAMPDSTSSAMRWRRRKAAALLRLQQLREEMMEQLGEWHEGVAS